MFRKSLPAVLKQIGRLATLRNVSLNASRVCLTANYVLFEKYKPVEVVNRRSFAKGKNIKKNKKKTSSKVNEHDLAEVFDLDLLFREMTKPVNYLKADLAENVNLRTSQGVIENIKVVYENEVYYLQDLAEVSKKSPKLYVVDLSGFPQALPMVCATLQESELNLNPQKDGTKIYIPIPRVTKEHREILAKKCKSSFVKCRDSIREVQLKYLKKLESNDKLSEDDKSVLRTQLAALADKHVLEAKEIMTCKQNDLLNTE